jgi:hypothetical protein
LRLGPRDRRLLLGIARGIASPEPRAAKGKGPLSETRRKT